MVKRPQMNATRWYLRHANGCIMLTVERTDDQRGYTMAWPHSLGCRRDMRRIFRGGLHLLRERVALIGETPKWFKTYDPVEVPTNDADPGADGCS